jgi:hypothetical protein
MLDRQLSRWTLAWFAAAFGWLIAGMLAMACGFGGPGLWATPEGLALVHVVALGWLGHMMSGALIQFAPVLAARPLRFAGLALPALVAQSGGVAALVAGFLHLGDAAAEWLMPLAVTLLLGGMTATAVMVVPTLWPDRSAAARMVTAAFAGLALAASAGASLALSLAGLLPTGGLLTGGVPFHALAGIGAWLSVATFGVSYRLFPMFLVAPDREGRLRHVTLWLARGMIGLVALALGLALADAPAGVALAAILAVSVIAVVLYLADIRAIWRARRRPRPEANMRMTPLALGFLALAVALSPVAAWQGGNWAEAAVAVALLGWLTTLTLAQVIKITSFLTWIQVFAPQIGRGPLPMVHDLTSDPVARGLLWLWATGVAGLAVALAAGSDMLFRLAALLLFLSAAGVAAECLWIRRLSHLPASRRPAALPPVILPPKRPEFAT